MNMKKEQIDILYTNGDAALYADYSGSMFVGIAGEIPGWYKVKESFQCSHFEFEKLQLWKLGNAWHINV